MYNCTIYFWVLPNSTIPFHIILSRVCFDAVFSIINIFFWPIKFPSYACVMTQLMNSTPKSVESAKQPLCVSAGRKRLALNLNAIQVKRINCVYS